MDKLDKFNLSELLDYIDPARLSYEEWLSVGMALKLEGYPDALWDTWSRRDARRYHEGECAKKWSSFNGAPAPVAGGSIVHLAQQGGWRPDRDEGRELGWNDIIGGKEDLVVVNHHYLEGKDIEEPKVWNPSQEIITYISTLFGMDEIVGYVTESWEQDGRSLPTKGIYGRTAGELISSLTKYRDDIGAALGDYKPEAGAWIRFNPLDGKGVKNDNVTAFRYALVESDSLPVDQQNALIRELELPVACLVHSGGKSLHAIVRVEADNIEEYRKRVDFLYSVCKKNGLQLDSQNRNPSRLSRMPGVIRKEHKQFLVDTNIGKASWQEWKDWIEAVSDDLPDPENMSAVWDNLPDLSPSLINGILRQGHKLLLAGPSKAGKSYSLIELCCAIAEGRKWLSWACAQGRVLYVNLELDRASCLHRFRDVYTALGWAPKNIHNIDIWNLRGKSVPMDKLAPKLIRRAAKKSYLAIIIDPIYKVITGDENSADQMAHFCNQFDKVCTELGCAVIYCHHHSKGGQGSKKSMDRASGSGVFARDPDALIDLIELELTEALVKQQEDKAVCTALCGLLNDHLDDWEDVVGQDDALSPVRLQEHCKKLLPGRDGEVQAAATAARETVSHYSAWRIEGTLREFPKFSPVNLWFTYPIHRVDTSDVLQDVEADGAAPPWQKALGKRKMSAKSERRDKNQELEDAMSACNFGEPPSRKELADYLGISERTVSDRIRAHGGYALDKNTGRIVRCAP